MEFSLLFFRSIVVIWKVKDDFFFELLHAGVLFENFLANASVQQFFEVQLPNLQGRWIYLAGSCGRSDSFRFPIGRNCVA